MIDAEPAKIVPAQFLLPPDRMATIERNVQACREKGVPFNGASVLYVSWACLDGSRRTATIIGGFANAEKFAQGVQRFEAPTIVVIGRKPYQGLPARDSLGGFFVAPEHVVRTVTEGERAVLAHEKKLILPPTGS